MFYLLIMVILMATWRELVSRLFDDAKFQPPATASQLQLAWPLFFTE